MAAETLTQKDLAVRLAITPRQIRNLHDEGLPREDSGRYPWPEARDWYVEFKQHEHVRRLGFETGGSESFEKARARKTAAEADLKLLQLAERRGILVPVDVIQTTLARVAERIRQRILGIPDRWALELVGLEEEADARAVLERAVSEALEDLAALGSHLADSPMKNGKR